MLFYFLVNTKNKVNAEDEIIQPIEIKKFFKKIDVRH
jgi:hypothetical protein